MSLSNRRLRNLLKKVLLYKHQLALYHRWRNRRTLTVVVFHRVLRRDDPRWASAHREWTVSDDFFGQCLAFFRRHYNLVGLDELRASLSGGRRLPPRSLLVTFDDGYADNEEYALPLLRQYRVPAVLFLTTAFVNRCSRPWTEDLMTVHARGGLSPEEITGLHRLLFPEARGSGSDAAALLGEVCAHWAGLPDEDVETVCSAALRQPLERLTAPAQMLTGEQVRLMHAAGVAIGAHGRTHISMPLSADLDSELREPRRTLSALLGLPRPDSIDALAFPFGDYSEPLVARALDEGYDLLFTFRPGITPLPGGLLTSHVLDRVNVSEPTLAPDGVTTPERLARYFFFQPWSHPSAVGKRA